MTEKKLSDVLPLAVGLSYPFRYEGSAVFQLAFDVDESVLGDGYDWFSGTAIIHYDVEAGAIVDVDAPFSAFQEGLIAYYDAAPEDYDVDSTGHLWKGLEAAIEAQRLEGGTKAGTAHALFETLCRACIDALSKA